MVPLSLWMILYNLTDYLFSGFACKESILPVCPIWNLMNEQIMHKAATCAAEFLL